MSTPRFIVSELDGDRITIVGREAHHAARVRRLRVGDAVELFDGRGAEATGTIAAITKDRIEVSLNERHASASQRTLLTIAAAIPKGDRADWMVEKLAELGANRLTPLITERSVVRPSHAKLERWRRKCLETAKQCRSTVAMEVSAPVCVSDLAEMIRDSVQMFVADPDPRWPPLLDCVVRHSNFETIAVIGPEGGLTHNELKLLHDAGGKPVRLTSTILRIETAAIVMAAALALRTSRD